MQPVDNGIGSAKFIGCADRQYLAGILIHPDIGFGKTLAGFASLAQIDAIAAVGVVRRFYPAKARLRETGLADSHRLIKADARWVVLGRGRFWVG